MAVHSTPIMKIWDDLSRQKVLPTPVSIDVFLRDLFLSFYICLTIHGWDLPFSRKAIHSKHASRKFRAQHIHDLFNHFSTKILKLLIFTSKIKLNFSLFKIDYFSKNFENFSSHYKQKIDVSQTFISLICKNYHFPQGGEQNHPSIKKGIICYWSVIGR